MELKELRHQLPWQQDLPRSEQGFAPHLRVGRGGRGTRTWQYEDVHKRLAVIETRRHHTVCPQPLGSQLIHFPAGGNGVAAGHHPVVGGRRHNHPDPPYKTADKSGQVQAGGHHVGPSVGQGGQESAHKVSAELAGELRAADPG